ncbi:MAG: hypothetical protein ABI396_18255, partial [Ktedonobacteraceae bacterium]
FASLVCSFVTRNTYKYTMVCQKSQCQTNFKKESIGNHSKGTSIASAASTAFPYTKKREDMASIRHVFYEERAVIYLS